MRGGEKPQGLKAHVNSCTLYAALEGPLFHGDTRIQVTRETGETMNAERVMNVLMTVQWVGAVPAFCTVTVT